MTDFTCSSTWLFSGMKSAGHVGLYIMITSHSYHGLTILNLGVPERAVLASLR